MLSELKLLLIGCGKMGSAMLEGWVKHGVEPQNVNIVDPYANMVDFSDKCKNLYKDVSEITDTDYDICIIAVKPQSFAEVVPAYKHIVRDNCVFASIAAGVTVETTKKCLGENARIVRVMPNLPATVGAGISGIYSDNNVSFEQIKNLKLLLQSNGEVIETKEESEIDKITAISGSGPAYIFYFIECLEQIALEYGFDETSSKLLATETVFGAAKLASESKLDASELRVNVTSPKGTTEAALKTLMDKDRGLKKLLKATVEKARLRAKKLNA